MLWRSRSLSHWSVGGSPNTITMPTEAEFEPFLPEAKAVLAGFGISLCESQLILRYLFPRSRPRNLDEILPHTASQPSPRPHHLHPFLPLLHHPPLATNLLHITSASS